MEMNILHALQELHNPVLDSIMVFITSLGNAGAIWIVLSIIFICIKKYRKCGITMAVALLIFGIFGNVIMKNVFARSRPCWIDDSVKMLIKIPKDYSFPSGHTSVSFAGAFAIFLYYKKAGIAAFVLASLIAFSRLYLFVHYPTDVAAGVLIGLLCAAASFFIVRQIYERVFEKVKQYL